MSLITKVCVVEVDETDVDNMTISNNVAFTNKIAVELNLILLLWYYRCTYIINCFKKEYFKDQVSVVYFVERSLNK